MPEWLFFTAVISLVVGVAAYAKGLYTGRDESEFKVNSYMSEASFYKNRCEFLTEKNNRLQDSINNTEMRLKTACLKGRL